MTSPATDERSHRPRRDLAGVLVSLGLLVCVCAAFSPALGGEFLAWDDDRNFLQNRAYRGLGLENLRWMFTTFHMGHYQPLSWLSLGLDFEIHGMDARGYHATNVILHAATTIAVFHLAHRLLALTAGVGRAALLAGALLAAVVFGLHPLRVESVAWITERRDVLGGLFFVLALTTWVRFATGGARRWYWAAVALVLVSLSARAGAIVMPALLLVLDVWPLRRTALGWRALGIEKLPFVAASVVFGWLAIRAQASQGATLVTLAQHGPEQRAVQALFGAAFYPCRTLVPLNLIPIHEIPEPFDPWSGRFIGPAVLVVVFTIGLVLLRKRAPALLATWVAYLVVLAPTSGVAQAGAQLVADRYSYASCIPFALLAGLGVVLLGRARLVAPPWIVTSIGALALLLGVSTWRQSHFWRDSDSLWRRTVAISPRSPYGNLSLGAESMRRGAAIDDPTERERLFAEAERHLTACLAVRDEPQAHVNLGLIELFRAQRATSGAREIAERGLTHIRSGIAAGERRYGVEPQWRLALGSALLTSGRCDEAVLVLEEVLRLMPGTEAALRSTSLALECVGRTEEALAVLERALVLEPDDATLWMRAGDWNRKVGRIEQARVSYTNVMALRERALGGGHAADAQWITARRALDDLP